MYVCMCVCVTKRNILYGRNIRPTGSHKADVRLHDYVRTQINLAGHTSIEVSK